MDDRREQRRLAWNRNYGWLFVAAGVLFAWSSFTTRDADPAWVLWAVVGLAVAGYGAFRVRRQR